jgi:DNA helicase-2/ATP-dependent DNA helicase PcrA
MIPEDQFIDLVCAAIPRFQQYRPNTSQVTCINHGQCPQMIVAGPGSGKTTVLVLRALRHVYVDGLLPEQIVITTFTKKAADEIRSRLIDWGTGIGRYLAANPPEPCPAGFDDWLDTIDVNRFPTGTLDSICEDCLTNFRDPDDPAPVLVEGFVSNALMTNESLFANNIHSDQNVAQYLSTFTFDGNAPRAFADKIDICRVLFDRFVHDRVDINSYRADAQHTAARHCVADAAESYRVAMADQGRLDFALLEEEFLLRLTSNRLTRFTDSIRAVLVDEYQDTNPLQELIYFHLVQLSDSIFTIVGDDDQSLYRFRGATVELFRDFSGRYANFSGGPQPKLNYLVENYRSTPQIVNFVNSFVATDPEFPPARVQPPKPPIREQLQTNGVPILGLFRQERDQLADSLSDFLWSVFRGDGFPIHVGGQTVNIARNADGGDFGDCVILSRTVNEFTGRFRGNDARERLPRMLRTRIEARGGHVFNPRGIALRDVPVVQQLLGLMLECIDPNSTVEQSMEGQLRADTFHYFAAWRQAATELANSNPTPNIPHTLKDFVQAWANQQRLRAREAWPPEWPILELCFKLITWIPALHDDPEGQVYLEAMARCFSQSALFSRYRSTIVFTGEHRERSVRSALRDIFQPLAVGAIDVDEDIVPSVPRDRLQFMTIHQSKGLEFPMVVVDVSSDFKTNHRTQRFARFPETPSNVTRGEDDLAPHCEIGGLRTARSALDRTFDDLVRLYYVAYSRPMCVLLLVGLDPGLRHQTTIPHVAKFWSRASDWAWRTPVDGRNPGLANNIDPYLHLI